MTRGAYYNEIDPAAVAILHELIARGVIAPGDVDSRSIKEVSAYDLRGYTQCHFFAGGGLWSVAARLAGWSDDRPLWTGSCPCQGESLAGKRLGADDPRHLWPDFHRLIRSGRPPVVVGEQVAAAAGTHWLDRVCSDLEDEDYAMRAVDIPACAVDGPHQRQRIYWVAMDDRIGAGLEGQRGNGAGRRGRAREAGPIAASDVLIFADADRRGCAGRPEGKERRSIQRAAAQRLDGSLFGDAEGERRGEGRSEHEFRRGRDAATDADARDGLRADAHELAVQGLASAGQQPIIELDAPALPNGSWWADYEWIVSPIDGKARRSKPGIPFLVDGLPGRVDLWRVGGNAIVPQLAAEVLAALLETIGSAA